MKIKEIKKLKKIKTNVLVYSIIIFSFSNRTDNATIVFIFFNFFIFIIFPTSNHAETNARSS